MRGGICISEFLYLGGVKTVTFAVDFLPKILLQIMEKHVSLLSNTTIGRKHTLSEGPR